MEFWGPLGTVCRITVASVVTPSASGLPAVSQPWVGMAPLHHQYVPCAGQAPRTGISRPLRVGNLSTVISLLFMNVLILKQQVPGSADLQLFLVGAFQAVPLRNRPP